MSLPSPMLARTGPLNKRACYGWEVKWDGFRAIVSTVDGCVRAMSFRGGAGLIS